MTPENKNCVGGGHSLRVSQECLRGRGLLVA